MLDLVVAHETWYWYGAGASPPSPTGLATALVAGPQVNLTWSLNGIADATSQSVERRDVTAGGSWSEIDTVAGGAESYQGDVGAFEPRTRYEYRVVIVGGSSDGLTTNIVSVIPLPTTDRRRRLTAAL